MPKACTDYRVDMTAKAFGDCVCGFPKAAHSLNGAPTGSRNRCNTAPGGGVSAVAAARSRCISAAGTASTPAPAACINRTGRAVTVSAANQPSFSPSVPATNGDEGSVACSDYKIDVTAARFGDCLHCGRPKLEHKSSAVPTGSRVRGTSAAPRPFAPPVLASAPSTEQPVACDDYRMDLTSPKAGVCKNCGCAKSLHTAVRPAGGGASKHVLAPAPMTRVDSGRVGKRASRVAEMQAKLKEQSEQLAATANYAGSSKRLTRNIATPQAAAPSPPPPPPPPPTSADEKRERAATAPDVGRQIGKPATREAASSVVSPEEAVDYHDYLATRGKMSERMLRKQHSSVGRDLLSRASMASVDDDDDDDDDDDVDSSEEDDEFGAGEEALALAGRSRGVSAGRGDLQHRNSLVWGVDGSASRYKRTHL